MLEQQSGHELAESRIPVPHGGPAFPKGLHLPERRLRFHGDGGSLFGLMIVNALLALCTLGIYHFWGKTRVRHYLLSHTDLEGDRFAYHGTGKELFLGWLKVMGAVMVAAALLGIAGAVFKKEPAVMVLLMLAFYGGIFCLIPTPSSAPGAICCPAPRGAASASRSALKAATSSAPSSRACSSPG